MTSFRSPSSSPTNPTSFTVSAPPQTSTVSSRPFPLPCWSHEETVSLIDAYRDKWYSLRRGNLRASDWQDVADDVANRCQLPSGNPQKTSTQCRHKMEKLRKRYRSEIQRAAANHSRHRYLSPWIHFKQMDLMEKGSNSMYQDEDDESEEASPNPPNQRFHNSIDCRNGIRIKIPEGIPLPETELNWAKSSYRSGGGRRRVEVVGGGGGGDNSVKEMAAAINKLGDRFVRVERMKMEMVKEVESMRLELEMKRTEMIIESHQRIADSFLDSTNKKLKRMHASES